MQEPGSGFAWGVKLDLEGGRRATVKYPHMAQFRLLHQGGVLVFLGSLPVSWVVERLGLQRTRRRAEAPLRFNSPNHRKL